MAGRPLILCLLLIGLLRTSCGDAEAERPTPPTATVSTDRFRSITFSSRRQPEPGTFEELRDLGVSHVTLITFGYQPAYDIPEIRFDPNRRWFSESDSGLTALAHAAEDFGMGTILKPHIWVGRHSADGQQRHQVGFGTEEDWNRWEASYRRFILHYADLAEEIGADIFVVGTELATAALERPNFWRSVIRDIRCRYRGKLTYAANWYREYESIEFWQDLDLIGVQAYFPLTADPTPTETELRAGWAPHRESLESISRRLDRKILFTEIGYRSAPGSATEPWRWASRKDVAVVSPDYDLQANLYKAFFDVVWPEPWFAGASFWRWHAPSDSRRPVRAIDFTPQHKPALDVLRTGFAETTTSARHR